MTSSESPVLSDSNAAGLDVLKHDSLPLPLLRAANADHSSRIRLAGSRIQGWGLFARHPIHPHTVVIEYLGEYVRNSVADKREADYQRARIQDYQFRVGPDLVLDATKKGSDLGGTATQTCTKQVRVVYALACECEGGVAVW